MEINPVQQRGGVVYKGTIFKYMRFQNARFKNMQGRLNDKIFIRIIEIGDEPLMVYSQVQGKQKDGQQQPITLF